MAKGVKRRQEEAKSSTNEAQDAQSGSNKKVRIATNGDDNDSDSDSAGSSDDNNDESVDEEDDLSGIEDDEVNLDDGDSEDEGEDDDEENKPARKRPQNESFSKAISAILGSKVKAHDRDDPILVRSKKTAKDLETSKLEAKAKRAINQEKRLLKDKDRVKDVLPKDEENAREVLDHEKKLKQIAQKGVVRLFNAVLAAQSKPSGKNDKKSIGLQKQEEQVNDMSKEKFLDLIRAGGSSNK